MSRPSEPLKTGFVVGNSSRTIEDLPVRLLFADSCLTKLDSNEMYVGGIDPVVGDTIYARLDATNQPFTGNVSVPQLTATSTGASLFYEGLKISGGDLILGAGSDMKMYYDGTNGNIDTDLVAASDLVIDCGTGKTLVMEVAPTDEIRFFPTAGKAPPAGTAPTWEAFTTNTAEYAFSVDDLLDLSSEELPHWWDEGTAGDLHLHFAIKTAQSTGANRYAKFTVYITISDIDGTWSEVGPYTAEKTIPDGSAALTHFYLDMGNITLTNYNIGGGIKARVKRIAATGGTEYADDVYITQVGVHMKRPRIGSRTETTA